MTIKYCTHFACRIAHERKEGSRRAARQRETHAGKAPCTLEEIYTRKVEANIRYGKFLHD